MSTSKSRVDICTGSISTPGNIIFKLMYIIIIIIMIIIITFNRKERRRGAISNNEEPEMDHITKR